METLIYKKFDNPILNEIRDYGGSPCAVYKQLHQFKLAGQSYYKSFGLIDYKELIFGLSQNDMDILIAIKDHYNYPTLDKFSAS